MSGYRARQLFLVFVWASELTGSSGLQVVDELRLMDKILHELICLEDLSLWCCYSVRRILFRRPRPFQFADLVGEVCIQRGVVKTSVGQCFLKLQFQVQKETLNRTPFLGVQFAASMLISMMMPIST